MRIINQSAAMQAAEAEANSEEETVSPEEAKEE